MKLPKKFEEYVAHGIIKKVSPDISRAEFLIKESKNSLDGLKERIEKIGIHEKNASSIIKDCYDIIMELIRAKLLFEGYSSSGKFSHEAEVSYLKKADFLDNDVSFLNELRFYRNSVTYYGKIVDRTYAGKVFDFMNKLLPQLYEMLKR